MSLDKRSKNIRWGIKILENGKSVSAEDAALAVLMDIRDELQELNKISRSIRRVMPPRRPK